MTLDELEKLAKVAMPGPWLFDRECILAMIECISAADQGMPSSDDSYWTARAKLNEAMK